MTDIGGAIRRLNLGFFIRPEDEVGDEPRVEPVLGYLVRRPEGLLLFDSGFGPADEELDAHYRPHRRDLADALAAAGVALDDITIVVNCHLHFDHCGGNRRMPGRPIFVQSTELSTARGPDYTLPELVDFPGANYQLLDGEAEIWPGIWIIPTPGHTDGHQSLVIRQSDGTIVLAGQAHDYTSQYTSHHLAYVAARAGVAPPLPAYRPWLERIVAFDPRRVLFAHDSSVWEPLE